MFTEVEKEWMTELEIKKLTPILEELKGMSFKQAKNLIKKVLDKLEQVKEERIF